EEAKPLLAQGAALIVTTENISGKWPVPVISLAEKKPLKLKELLADIERILEKPADTMDLGHYQFLPREKLLKVRGKKAALTDKEAQLVQQLAGAGAKGVSKEDLLKAVWGFEAELNTHTLETHIYRLREKFRELGDKDMIIAENGGYKLAL